MSPPASPAGRLTKAVKGPGDAAVKPPKPPYDPTPAEDTAVRAYFSARKALPPRPRLKVASKPGHTQTSVDHPDQGLGGILLAHAIGGADSDFLHGLLEQLCNAGSQGGKVDEKTLNFMVSVISGLEPRDQLEAMLGAQMAAIHLAMMTFSRRLANVDNIPQQDSAERGFNKLARTFAAQMEALKRYRSSGEQKITVVKVSDGGQAIVGTVNHSSEGGGGEGKDKDQPHALEHARRATLWCEDPARAAVPVAEGQRA